jgi:hypothetical protein
MKLLEIELDLQDPLSLLRTVDKFIAREVIIKDSQEGVLHGQPLARKGKSYVFVEYRKLMKDRKVELRYANLQQMTLINPKEEDYRKARLSYQEVTPNTIRVNRLASRRTSTRII